MHWIATDTDSGHLLNNNQQFQSDEYAICVNYTKNVIKLFYLQDGL